MGKWGEGTVWDTGTFYTLSWVVVIEGTDLPTFIELGTQDKCSLYDYTLIFKIYDG